MYNLLSGKARAAIGNQKSKPSFCFFVPIESELLLARCSSIRRTTPIKEQVRKVRSQRSHLKGLMKIHMSLSLLFLTTIIVPVSEYGRVKSTYVARSAKMVVSPTTISKVYFRIKRKEKPGKNDATLLLGNSSFCLKKK